MTKTMTTMSGGCPVRATNAPSWSCAAPAWSGKTKTGSRCGARRTGRGRDRIEGWRWRPIDVCRRAGRYSSHGLCLTGGGSQIRS